MSNVWPDKIDCNEKKKQIDWKKNGDSLHNDCDIRRLFTI